jgi:hypothetical protein
LQFDPLDRVAFLDHIQEVHGGIKALSAPPKKDAGSKGSKKKDQEELDADMDSYWDDIKVGV